MALLVLVLALASGCGAGSSSPGSSGESESTATPTPAPTTTTTPAGAATAFTCETERQTIETAAVAFEVTNGRLPASTEELVGPFLKPGEFAYDAHPDGPGPDAELVLTLTEVGRARGCPEPPAIAGGDSVETTVGASG